MRAVAEGRLEKTSKAFATHIDRCLGCRACEQVCPAGVEYGQLLEASREVLLEAQPKSDLANRVLRFVLRHVWLSPWRLRVFFGAARLFRDLGLARLLLKTGFMPFAIALLESSKDISHAKAPRRKGRRKVAGQAVLLFEGCVGEGLLRV
jgi:glycolate oxidase iron-sulfur subunit